MNPIPAALVLLTLICTTAALAQAPADSRPVKPIPPIGNDLPAADRAELEAGAAKLGNEIDALRNELAAKPGLLALLPDIQIYHNAVRYPLIYRELIDVKHAREALADADGRLQQLRAGNPAWVNQTAPRGYVSRIDGSVQPYVLSVPETYKPDDRQTKYRFDFWCHGRAEDPTELKFIRSKELISKTHFVVNLYGRYCNANKFAGEIDLLEVLADVRRRYPVDENRLVGIGFSMGGAAAWQFAVHYTDLFAAASPGAGFSESRHFLRIPQAEVDAMAPWQRKLWHLYDCTDWARSLNMLPTVAYTGELDPQKQASDVMLAAAAAERIPTLGGHKVERLIGPGTKHVYHKETREALDKRLAEIVAKGRDPIPRMVQFTTWTLRYNRMFWVRVEGLERHWERADVKADMTVADEIHVSTNNVSAFALEIPPQDFLIRDYKLYLKINNQEPKGYRAKTGKDGRLQVLFSKTGGIWSEAKELDGLRKRHGLQGPIDDAFMDSFLIVKPTAAPLHDAVGKWAAAEADHAVAHWQKQFRGEARVKRATDVTDADIAAHNLILFGDPSSNPLIAKIAPRLPIRWDKDAITVGDKTYPADRHALTTIYPNPLNPDRYVVLNSGFTFREFDYLNNARQTPKLPDWAVIDVSVPVTPKAPGKIADADFFDEQWRLAR